MIMVQVLKPFYWSIDRKVRRLPSIVIILGVTLPLLLIERLVTGVDVTRLTADIPLALVIVSGVAAAVVLMLLDVNHIVYQFFESPELTVLMVHPVPLRTVYTLKLVQAARTLILVGPGLLILLSVIGYQRGAGVGFYLLMGLIVFGSMITVATTIMSMVLLICRFVPPRYLRAAILVLFTLLPIGLVFVQTDLLLWLSTQAAMLSRFSEQIVMFASVTVPVGLLMIGVSFRIFTTTFYEGRIRFSTVQPTRERVPTQGWFAKEWRVLRRDVRLLMGFLQPLAFLVLLLLPWWQGVEISEEFSELIFWFTLIVAAQLNLTIPLLGGRMLTKEGRAIGLLRTAPVNLRLMLRTKLIMVGVPAYGVWVVSVLMLTLLYRFAAWQVALLLGVSLISGGFALLSTMGLSALFADFSAERIPTLASVAATAFNLLWAVLSVAVAVWAAWHVAEARTILELLNIAPPVVLWLPLLGMMMGLSVLAIILWQRGCMRLNTLEVHV